MPAGRPSLPTLPKGFKTRGLSFGSGAIVKPQVDYESQGDKARRLDREAKEANAANESDQESSEDEKSECSSDSNKSDCEVVEDGFKPQPSHDSQVKEGEADSHTTVKSKRKRKKKTKVKPSKRNNWLKSYELRFGTWIKKIPYKDENGQTRYQAGCIPCEKKGKTRVLGAKPTKKLKTSTFKDHARSQEHKDAVKAVKEDHLRQKKGRDQNLPDLVQKSLSEADKKKMTQLSTVVMLAMKGFPNSAYADFKDYLSMNAGITISAHWSPESFNDMLNAADRILLQELQHKVSQADSLGSRWMRPPQSIVKSI